MEKSSKAKKKTVFTCNFMVEIKGKDWEIITILLLHKKEIS